MSAKALSCDNDRLSIQVQHNYEKKYLKHLEGSKKIQAFSWTIVYKVDNVLQIIIRNISKRSAFREKLPQKSIGIFICATLPGRVRVAEINFHTGCFGKLLMSSKFFPIVHGKAFLQLVGNRGKGFNSCFVKRIILPIVNPESNKETGFSFNMSTETTCFPLAQNRIIFPVTETCAVFRTCRTFADWRCIWDFATFVLGFALLVFPLETHDFL